MQAAGFVLVGGLSSRMGQDKALLLSGSYPLVRDVAEHVAVAAGNVALVGRRERYTSLGFDCIEDLRPNLGPLSGIESALVSRRGELNLVVACDMPGLTAGLLQGLLQYAVESGALCVVSRDRRGTIHPLCAVYHSNCLPVVQRALDAGQLRLLELIEELGAARCDVDEIIWNVNTPQEWSAWREQQFSMEQLSSEGARLALTDGD